MSDPVQLRQEFTELEMAYTPFHDACGDPLLDTEQAFRRCRRFRGHVGSHASAFPYLEWDNKGDTQ